MELKRSIPHRCNKETDTINRTLVELKHRKQRETSVAHEAINRTLVELKLAAYAIICICDRSINRTLVELKLQVSRAGQYLQDYQSYLSGIKTRISAYVISRIKNYQSYLSGIKTRLWWFWFIYFFLSIVP